MSSLNRRLIKVSSARGPSREHSGTDEGGLDNIRVQSMDVPGSLPRASNQLLEDGLPVQCEETLQSIMDSLPNSPTHFREENRGECRQDWTRKEEKGGKESFGTLAQDGIDSEHLCRSCPIMYFDSRVHETGTWNRGILSC